ncbi:MAG: DNA polymerase III subunit gamma/tau [Porticoccaceae bacterium]
MSYQVLARKWRPRYFDEMAGQEHVLKALVNALDNDRLHHAYLFTGTRGVGKTTIARILAKCLNCDLGVSSKPCGTCGSCMEIAEGRFVDLIEVDAASRTKVEDTRELLDNVQYAPTRGRFKVYLIDEVHMLSGHSFNALLKTLEEPPPHVKFLLATTEPQKLPATILSRCLQFNLKNLSPERIVEHLSMVLKEENIPFEEAALWALARAASGSMRDALSLTDQAIAHGNGTVMEGEVSAMLGTIDRSTVLDICRALAARDGVEVLRLVDDLAEHSPDYAAALADMIGVWHQVAVAQAVPEALDTHGGNAVELLALANSLSREDVQLFYQICLLGRRDLPYAGEPRTGFEMILLRQLAFEPMAAGASVPAAAGAGAVVKPAVGETPEPVKKSEGSGVNPDVSSAELPPLDSYVDAEANTGSAQSSAPATSTLDKLDRIAEAPPKPETSTARPSPSPSLSPSPSPSPETATTANSTESDSKLAPKLESKLEPIALAEFSPEHWRAVYSGLALGGIIENTAANLILIKRQGAELWFRLDADNDALYDEGHRKRLETALVAYFGESLTVNIDRAQITSAPGETAAETPRAAREREQYERQQAAIKTMREDPVVNTLIERFNGELLEDTISPLEE